MPEGFREAMGGTMRLGGRLCRVQEGSLAFKLYGGKTEVIERHRHRYEVNPLYVSRLETEGGLRFSGVDEDKQRMEIVEIPEHPFFIASQFHPEFTTRPQRPNALFHGFILACAGKLQPRLAGDVGVHFTDIGRK
jgi:CTP synthase